MTDLARTFAGAVVRADLPIAAILVHPRCIFG
jgi:hypothetical protein